MSRLQNARFLAWEEGSEHQVMKKLSSVSHLSAHIMFRGQMGEVEARTAEADLKLPDGWFDRDNMRFTKLDAKDHSLLSKILAADPRVKQALSAFVDAYDRYKSN